MTEVLSVCVCVCFHFWQCDLFFEVFYISPSSGLTSDSSMTFHHFRDDRLNVLRRPLHCECHIATAIAKETEKRRQCSMNFRSDVWENNFCGMNFWGISDYWLHPCSCPWQKTGHPVTRWKSEMEWNVFALFGSQPLATNCSHLAIKRRWIPVWREACMSRCISCRVLQVSLVLMCVCVCAGCVLSV